MHPSLQFIHAFRKHCITALSSVIIFPPSDRAEACVHVCMLADKHLNTSKCITSILDFINSSSFVFCSCIHVFMHAYIWDIVTIRPLYIWTQFRARLNLIIDHTLNVSFINSTESVWVVELYVKLQEMELVSRSCIGLEGQ